jgi:hypothetical protein
MLNTSTRMRVERQVAVLPGKLTNAEIRRIIEEMMG